MNSGIKPRFARKMTALALRLTATKLKLEKAV
jgi:hypothetical protein